MSKKKSKRMTIHLQNKIKKKVTEARRKQRKEARLNPQKTTRKDPGIPNMFPFKDELLTQIENHKAMLSHEKEEEKEARHKAKLKKSKMSLKREQNKLSRMDAPKETPVHKALSQRSLYREFWKVVEAADVLLEVLDARDPLGCRCTDVEEAIRARHPEKKVLLVLNKIDLVPKSVVEEWAVHLKNELPTVLFKSSTSSSKGSKSGKLRHSNVDPAHAPRGLLESSQCIGADLLMHMLKNYSRREGQSLKTAITVGIIGYPNVGKSSVINSLRRVKSVEVGGQAGVTRVMQEIKLDSKVKLLDCPGIIFTSGDSVDVDADVILRNCVNVNDLEDPVMPVDAIIKRCGAEQLMVHYNVPAFQNAMQLCMHMAVKTGKLKKGGICDVASAAKNILLDWNSGKVPFYTKPPSVKKGTHVSAEILSQLSADFDLKKVDKDSKTIMASLPELAGGALAMESRPTAAKTSSSLLNSTAQAAVGEVGNDFDEEDEDEDDEDEDEEEEEEVEYALAPGLGANAPKANSKVAKKKMDTDGPEQRNKDLKKAQKMAKKAKRRTGGKGDDYDFGVDYDSEDSGSEEMGAGATDDMDAN